MSRNSINMHITIRISQQNPQGWLNLEHSLELDAQDFLEMAQILGRFNELAKHIKEEKGFTGTDWNSGKNA